MKKISVIGIGYVGVCTSVIFAKMGFPTICVDIDKRKIKRILGGKAPFYEPDLDETVFNGVKNKMLLATTNIEKAIKESDVTFICVGTPSRKDGLINLDQVKKVAKNIGRGLRNVNSHRLVVVKSTVTPGTTDSVIIPIIEEESGKIVGEDFGMCMNPEFLREGSAMYDSLNPDRIIIGEYDRKSGDTLMQIYKNFNCPKFRTDLRTAEMIKYASNAFLATKITFSNEIANICEKFNIDVYKVMKGVGLDSRINPHFLRAGCGFGGSCFPKDLKAIVAMAKSIDVKMKLINAVLEDNESQPLRVIKLAESFYKKLKNKEVALLGLSFKPDTDDVRETRALPIFRELEKRGAIITCYDPKAMKNFARIAKSAKFAKSAREAISGKDLCIIQSDWEEFKDLTLNDFKLMKKPIIIDGRRTFDPKELIEKGIIYRGIGWKNRE